MVVPVPPCFDPETPLTAEPAHVTVSVTEYEQMSESLYGSISPSLRDVLGGPSGGPVSDTSTIKSDDARASEVDSGRSVFDLPNESVPQLPDPISPRPGNLAGTRVETEGTLTEPITGEPLPVPEPVCRVDDAVDNNDEGGCQEASSDESDRHVPEASSRPIAAQPTTGIDQPAPVALQPEPSAAVVVSPQTIEATEPTPCSSSNVDFASSVVSDVLSTAIDAVASASRAAIATVENLIHGGSRCQSSATYSPDQGCEILMDPPQGADVDGGSQVQFMLFCMK